MSSATPNELLDARRALCFCGHNRAVHPHAMGCLAMIAGQLCRCQSFDKIPTAESEGVE